MIKLKLRELVEAQPSFVKLLRSDMEFKLAYRLKKLTKKVMEEYRNFDEIRIEAVKKYGVKQEDGNISIPAEKMEEFNIEMGKVLSEEIELDVQPIPCSLLEQTGVKMSPLEISLLEKFLEENENAEENKDN